MRILLFIWIAILAFFSYEYFALNFHTAPSVFVMLHQKGLIAFEPSPKPGRPLSLWLGWLGLGLMVIMNVYSMRKRFEFMQNMGNLGAWLNFHIFCGLLGPTFIFFHCNFKVRGLVGISFWSMVVSFTSGIIGRYVYLQLAGKRVDFESEADRWVARLKRIIEKEQKVFNEKEDYEYLDRALVMAGAGPNIHDPFTAFLSSFVGDMRLYFRLPIIKYDWPENARHILKLYAVNKRRAMFIDSYQRIMGYWHAFHFPFAIFMYLAAVIHVAAALVLGV